MLRTSSEPAQVPPARRPAADGLARGASATPLRVVHVVRQFYPAMGGMEECVLQLASRQRADGHDARVVTLDTLFDDPQRRRLAAEEVVRGIPVRRVRWWGSKRYPIAPGVLAHVRLDDIVHVHGVDFLFDFLGLMRPLLRGKLVLSTHGGFFHTDFASTGKIAYFNTITRAMLTRYAAVGASSEPDLACFRPLRKRDLHLVENGASLDKYLDLANREKRTIVYFGRWAPNKGLLKLVSWFAALHRADPAWRLVIAGRPSGVDADDLRGAAAACGIGDAVTVKAHPSDEEIADLIRHAAIFASASEYEGFGIAAVEAIAAGLFPLLSDIPPFRRTLEVARTGRLIDFDDAASAPAFLADWSKLKDGMPGESARVMEERFGWRRQVNQFEQIYRDVLVQAPRA